MATGWRRGIHCLESAEARILLKVLGVGIGCGVVVGGGAKICFGRDKVQLLLLHLSLGDVPCALHDPVPSFWGRFKTVSWG